MTMTPSNMLALGTKAADFSLPDTISGKMLSLQDVATAKATVIMFICNHCPFVQHITKEIVRVAEHYQKQDIHFIAISANDAIKYPQDGPEKMKQFAAANHFNFPYLYDESQSTAKAYQAACTPDLYVFDGDLRCVYRGQFDDARPNKEIPITGHDLRAALDAIIAGKPVNADQKPSVGCNIKWK